MRIFISSLLLLAHSALASTAWTVGSNYVTSNAVNELEMWQAPTFDPKRIDIELGWAQNLGLNTMRVFLHDLLWKDDPEGLRTRISTFLSLAEKHHIQVIFVLFDSCWNPKPHLGVQSPPVQGVHNSQWVQSPGLASLADSSQYSRLRDYVQGIIGTFAKDPRILAWDVWNEPDNLNEGSYHDPKSKLVQVEDLLPQVFKWAKELHPTQPLTSGLWSGDWSSPNELSAIQKTQITQSDIITFHSYLRATHFESQIRSLQNYSKPIICTEFLARTLGSTFEDILPIAKKYHVGVLNWGLVAGKTQTYLPWNSRASSSAKMPTVWFHDIFNQDGRPWSSYETRFITAAIKEEHLVLSSLKTRSEALALFLEGL